MTESPKAGDAPEAPEPDEERRARFTWVDLAVILSLGAVVAAIAVPNLIRSRKSWNESHAVRALRTITTAQSVFREGDKEQDGNLDYGMLSELSNVSLVEAALGSGRYEGYLFEASYSFRTSEFLWFAFADPEEPTLSGDRYFETSAAGVIFYTTDGNLRIDTDTCTLYSGFGPTCSGR